MQVIVSVTIHKHGVYLHFWYPFLCMWHMFLCMSTRVWAYMYVQVYMQLCVIVCEHVCGSQRLSLDVFHYFLPPYILRKSFLVELRSPWFDQSSQPSCSKQRFSSEYWGYRSAPILAYCLCESWGPECQPSCLDAKHFNYWDISLAPIFGTVSTYFIYFLIQILCTFLYLYTSFLWAIIQCCGLNVKSQVCTVYLQKYSCLFNINFISLTFQLIFHFPLLVFLNQQEFLL